MRILFGLIFVLSFAAEAKVVKLASITSEFDKDITEYYLELDNNNHIDSIRYVTIMPNGAIFQDITLPAEKVIRDGAVIVERDGYQAVRLEVENFSVVTGGTIKLNYLFNAVTGTRHVKHFNLHSHHNEFKISNSNNQIVNRMFLKANWLRLVGIVGVREIETSYALDLTE